MKFISESLFSFQSKALEEGTFAVVDFTGRQALSRCYSFDILLVTARQDIDFDQVISRPAKLVIHRQDKEDVTIHGVLAGFEQQQAAGEAVFYRATLVPRLWWLTLSHHNQVFLDQTVQQITEAVLQEAGLTSRDYEFRLQMEHPRLRYVCQYNETHLNFISRRLEREGIYYFFEQTEDGEKIIFTDTRLAHQASPLGDGLDFAPQAGLADTEMVEALQALVCRCKPMPHKVRLKDYNYRKPSLDVEATAVVDENGRGEVYLYGEHFRSPEQGKKLAQIRAQEIAWGKKRFFGDSTAPFLSPGYTFGLEGHFRQDFNRKYLLVEVTHEGSQAGSLTDNIKEALANRDRENFYRNQFVAIGADVQFRPLRTTPQPKITGTLNARIDAAGSGKYAELDDYGRYKVILPFDLSGRRDGKASAWLRMAQPYAGSDHGMHFPLHKGTEVLLTFIEGNPDRPVIAAAVPNAESPSPVTAADQTMAKVTTAGGNKIHMEDREGKQHVVIHSPTADTSVRLGSSGEGEVVTDKNFEEYYHDTAEKHEGYKIKTGGWYNLKAGGGKVEVIAGLEQKIIGGNSFEFIAGAEEKILLGGEVAMHFPERWTCTPIHTKIKELETSVNQMKTDITNEGNQIHNLSNIVRGVNNQVATELNSLRTNVNQLSAQVNTLEGEKNALQETVNQLSAMTNRITEMENSIAENSTKIAENKTSISQVDTKLSETDTRLTSNIVRLASTVTNIAGETLLV